MRGLLIVLCALVTLAAALAGGCAFLFAGVAAVSAPNERDAASLLVIAVPVLAVAAAVGLVNVALLVAIVRGRSPRRTGWFVLLAVADFVIATSLVAAGLFGGGGADVTSVGWLLLPAALVLKGILTLRLPAEIRRLPPADPGRE